MNANIHRVKKVIVGKNKVIARDDGSPFITRDIKVIYEDNNSFVLSLFSDRKILFNN